MSEPDIEARLDRLEARAEISELVARYCKACDDRDVPMLRSLFTRDAVVKSQDGVMTAEGVDAVMQMYKGRFDVLGISAHWTHDHILRFDDSDADHVTGEVFGHAESHRNGVSLIASLRYTDDYLRQGGAWKFRSRTLAFLYYVPVGEYAEAMGSPLRQRAYGDQRPADYPESLESWTGWTRHFQS
ncbi:nuclear transport factor 2 family protein [Rhodophyticola sp. CCM32]|uniref:nuclear transport factor 2 family protein n=1 Tax=Rhodophyticola sp. CCM32 TaxID=2916397 RepID=UPI00107F81AE|nr:nuclear transport factor 2 family protein [Rhodophyticola sp. CCM32]QBY01256.1 nuclear transport factor 2 family protein [Rhodophyticola sp. CCM32]